MAKTSNDVANGGSVKNSTRSAKGTSCSVRIFRNLLIFLIISGSLCSYIILGHLVSSGAYIEDLDAAMTHLHSLGKDFGLTESMDNQKNQTVPSRADSRLHNSTDPLPTGFRSVLKRAIRHQRICNRLNETVPAEPPPPNMTDLPNFGIINALSNYQPSSAEESKKWSQCTVPPATECNTTKFTAIFLAHNPDRLNHMNRMIGQMTHEQGEWTGLVEEVVVVWNGERNLNETQRGAHLEAMKNVRLVYPLRQGYPNDLLNRYNPDVVQVKTKAILYYDDDGPFYSRQAVQGGFELWKRNSNAQIGAMARKLDVGPRQVKEKRQLFEGLSDVHFVSHCRACGDSIFYNYYTFAHFDANMVLPSGSFLHSNFLCFIWHPALEELRQFVRDDAVHPDDATVSMVVSQVSGRAPKVYPRRINTKPQQRRLSTTFSQALDSGIDETSVLGGVEIDLLPKSHVRRRKLLWEQQGWGDMRNSAVNSLVSYFGGLNSGSLGWCYETEYHKLTRKHENVCDPEMAKVGMLPWMTENHEPKATCP